jgi:membrane peptidoglycan carboxypeptidase
MAEAEIKRKLGLTEDQMVSGGYKIVTTFSKALIADGVAAVKQSLPKDRPKRLQIGMASIDPRTGAVRAIYGGSDYLKRQQNAATQDSAEAGSTFKAFALLAALNDGVSLKNAYSSATPMKIKGYRVENFGHEQFGYIDLIKATEESVNTVYVQLNAQIGPNRTRAAAYAAGIPKSAHVSDTLSNVLGPANPHPIDLASAYATIAAQGIRRTPFVVRSVTEVSTGRVLLGPKSRDTKGVRVFPADVTADVSYALQHVVTGGTGTYAQRLNRPVAAKTGTSQNSRSAWFVGFTPQLATAVAMYQPSASGRSNVAMKGFGEFSTIFGGGYPCRVWTNYMQAALAGKPITPFPEPVWGGEVTQAKPTAAPTLAPTAKPTPTPPSDPTRTTPPAETATPTPTGSSTPTPTVPGPSLTGPPDQP